MDNIEKQTVMRMIEAGGHCVSLYMPTQRFFPDTKQNPIRLRNLLRQADEMLVAIDVRPAEARDMLQPAMELIENAVFWEYQEDGLACFITRDTFDCYRLPLGFDELVTAGDRFHIKPLLPLFSGTGDFFILALSQGDIKLLSCSRYTQKEITLEGVPRSIDEAVPSDDLQKNLQFHTGTTSRPGGIREAVYHGHGAGLDDAKDRVLALFFQQVDAGLQPIIGQENRPLVLAGVDYLFPIYRQASLYPHIVAGGISGNPEEMPPGQLRREGWKIVEPYFLDEKEKAKARYRAVAGTGRTSSDIEEIVSAAYSGRIETVFVALDVQQWGAFDKTTFETSCHEGHRPGDYDLLDYTAMRTFLKGGIVYAVRSDEMPDAGSAAAIFRY